MDKRRAQTDYPAAESQYEHANWELHFMNRYSYGNSFARFLECCDNLNAFLGTAGTPLLVAHSGYSNEEPKHWV